MRNRQIPLYRAEQSDGLADKILASASVAYVTAAQLATSDDISRIKPGANIEELAKANRALATNEGQIDLHYIKSLLVTTGWNKNGHIFDRKEMWAARSTPEDKPFNYEHDYKDIIGHMTGCYVVDEKNNILPDSSTIDDLPATFHIIDSAVLYKYWPDESLRKRMDGIIADIKGQGDSRRWYVSMEALFDDFDYGVRAPDGAEYVIPRSEESAFLTKHLRVYGGSGTYENHAIGQIIKNIIFSGKGLVLRPANENSVIFDNVTAFEKPITASAKEFKSVVYSISSANNTKDKERVMAVESTELELLRVENKRLEQTLQAASAAKADAEKRLQDMNEQAVKAKLSGLEDNIKQLTDKIAALNTQVKTEQDTRIDTERKFKEAETNLAKASEEINKAKREAAKATRLSAIKELTLEESEANSLFDNTSELSDEKFNKVVASFKKVKPQASTPAKVLDDVNIVKTPALGADGVNDNVEQVRQSLGTYLGSTFLKKNTNSAEK